MVAMFCSFTACFCISLNIYTSSHLPSSLYLHLSRLVSLCCCDCTSTTTTTSPKMPLHFLPSCLTSHLPPPRSKSKSNTNTNTRASPRHAYSSAHLPFPMSQLSIPSYPPSPTESSDDLPHMSPPKHLASQKGNLASCRFDVSLIPAHFLDPCCKHCQDRCGFGISQCEVWSLR